MMRRVGGGGGASLRLGESLSMRPRVGIGKEGARRHVDRDDERFDPMMETTLLQQQQQQRSDGRIAAQTLRSEWGRSLQWYRRSPYYHNGNSSTTRRGPHADDEGWNAEKGALDIDPAIGEGSSTNRPSAEQGRGRPRDEPRAPFSSLHRLFVPSQHNQTTRRGGSSTKEGGWTTYEMEPARSEKNTQQDRSGGGGGNRIEDDLDTVLGFQFHKSEREVVLTLAAFYLRDHATMLRIRRQLHPRTTSHAGGEAATAVVVGVSSSSATNDPAKKNDHSSGDNFLSVTLPFGFFQRGEQLHHTTTTLMDVERITTVNQAPLFRSLTIQRELTDADLPAVGDAAHSSAAAGKKMNVEEALRRRYAEWLHADRVVLVLPRNAVSSVPPPLSDKPAVLLLAPIPEVWRRSTATMFAFLLRAIGRARHPPTLHGGGSILTTEHPISFESQKRLEQEKDSMKVLRYEEHAHGLRDPSVVVVAEDMVPPSQLPGVDEDEQNATWWGRLQRRSTQQQAAKTLDNNNNNSKRKSLYHEQRAWNQSSTKESGGGGGGALLVTFHSLSSAIAAANCVHGHMLDECLVRCLIWSHVETAVAWWDRTVHLPIDSL